MYIYHVYTLEIKILATVLTIYKHIKTLLRKNVSTYNYVYTNCNKHTHTQIVTCRHSV